MIFNGERYKDCLLLALWETITVYSAYHNYKVDYGADDALDYYQRARDNVNLCYVSFRGLRSVCGVQGLLSAFLRILSSKSTRLIFHLKFRAFCISTQQNHSWKIQLGDQQCIFFPVPPTWIHSFCLLFRSFPGSPAAVPSFVLSISPLISPHPFLLLRIIHSDNTLCKEAILYSHSVFLWSSSLGCTQL